MGRQTFTGGERRAERCGKLRGGWLLSGTTRTERNLSCVWAGVKALLLLGVGGGRCGVEDGGGVAAVVERSAALKSSFLAPLAWPVLQLHGLGVKEKSIFSGLGEMGDAGDGKALGATLLHVGLWVVFGGGVLEANWLVRMVAAGTGVAAGEDGDGGGVGWEGAPHPCPVNILPRIASCSRISYEYTKA